MEENRDHASVEDIFFAPVNAAFERAENTRKCLTYSDHKHIEYGIRRLISPWKSGRAFVQAMLPFIKNLSVRNYFRNLEDPRRKDLVNGNRERCSHAN